MKDARRPKRPKPTVIPLRTPEQMPTAKDLEWLDREVMPKIEAAIRTAINEAHRR